MLHRISLLDELRKGGYEASLITTFNAYLPFYEDVILRRLVNAGSRHNVLLMDERQYSVSVGNHPPRLAGRPMFHTFTLNISCACSEPDRTITANAATHFCIVFLRTMRVSPVELVIEATSI